MAPKKKTTEPTETKKNTEDALVEESKTQAPILAILTKARTVSKKTIPQLSKELNIQTCYLKALEEGDTSTLPETVYTLGFVRSMANYLGLDAHRCVKDYKEQILFNRAAQKNVVIPRPPKESMAPKRAMLFVSLILVIGGYMGWLYVTEQNNSFLSDVLEVVENDTFEEGETIFDINEPEVEDPFAFEDQPVDPKTAENLKKKAIQIEASLRPTPEKEAKPIEKADDFGGEDSGLDHSEADIIIMATQRSWIEIKDKDKKILYRGILKEGDTYPVPKGEGMVFTTGNAGGIAFSYKGKKTPAVGRPGEVVRRIPLTKASLAKIGKPDPVGEEEAEGARAEADVGAEAEADPDEESDMEGDEPTAARSVARGTRNP